MEPWQESSGSYVKKELEWSLVKSYKLFYKKQVYKKPNARHPKI